MRSAAVACGFICLALVAAACLPQVGEPLDAGRLEPDAGAPDAGPLCTDGQRDGTESDVDCGGDCSPCALTQGCADARDCASGTCVGHLCAVPASVCPNAFSGCTSFVDLTADPSPTIRFPVGGDRYAPACVRLRLGQVVHFEGGFSSHPMQQTCGPVRDEVRASSGQRLDVALSGLGVYGYFCQRHGSASGSGMAGAIEVVR